MISLAAPSVVPAALEPTLREYEGRRDAIETAYRAAVTAADTARRDALSALALEMLGDLGSVGELRRRHGWDERPDEPTPVAVTPTAKAPRVRASRSSRRS